MPKPTDSASVCDDCYGGWFATHTKGCRFRVPVDWANLIGVPLLGIVLGAVYAWLVFWHG